MNRTIVILHLLVSSISVAKPVIEEATKAKIEEESYKVDDLALRSLDEKDGVLVKYDDILSTSDLNNIYKLVENKVAKTRSLKEDDDNRFTKANLKQEIRAAAKPKLPKNLNEQREEKKISNTDKEKEETGTKSAKSGENKLKEKSVPTTKVLDVESNKESTESKSVEDISESTELESTTATFRGEDKTADYLESDKVDYNENAASIEDMERKGYDMPINDESNSAWDLLDDLSGSRRMLSQPKNFKIESKATSDEKFKPVGPDTARSIPEKNFIMPSYQNPYGDVHINYGPPSVIPIPRRQSTTVSIPHNHPPLLPQRRFIVPGFIKIRPAVTIDLRRLLNQERNKVINQNMQYENYRSQQNIVMNQNNAHFSDRSEFTDVVENYNSKEHSNAYPYMPAVLETSEMRQAVNPIFVKLVEASKHPQRLIRNYNVVNLQNTPNMLYNNNVNKRPYYYVVPQNYGIYKYVNEIGSSRI